jgi:hypothetical protein
MVTSNRTNKGRRKTDRGNSLTFSSVSANRFSALAAQLVIQRAQEIGCRTERSHVGARLSRKRFRRVRPQAAFVVKSRPFVTELIGAAYDTFGQFAEMRRPAGGTGRGALAPARNPQ